MKGIEINIGKPCNNDCLFCGNGEMSKAESKWADENAVIKEMEDAAKEGYTSIGFLGGEVTVYPAALRVIAKAGELGFKRISLCTNGRRFGDRELLDKFLDAGVTRISLSIHSHQAEVEDRLNNRKKAFAQKEAAIRNCVAAERALRLADGFSLNTCIHGLNYKVLTESARFFKALGVKDIRYNSIRPERKALNNKELVPSYTDAVKEMVRLIIENEKSLRMTITFGDMPLCIFPETFIRQSKLGRQYIGELRDLDTRVTVLGDGIRPADRFMWKERRFVRHKKYLEQCAACAAGNVCEGVWTDYLDIYGTGEFHPLKT